MVVTSCVHPFLGHIIIFVPVCGSIVVPSIIIHIGLSITWCHHINVGLGLISSWLILIKIDLRREWSDRARGMDSRGVTCCGRACEVGAPAVVTRGLASGSEVVTILILVTLTPFVRSPM